MAYGDRRAALRQRLSDELERLAREWRSVTGTTAGRFWYGIRHNDPELLVYRLIHSDTTEGFQSLVSHERPDLTVEHLVARTPLGRELFPRSLREIAEAKLSLA